MMRDGWFAPTINLDNIDERCGKLDYIQGDGRQIQTNYVMNNNFAFGGVNTSLILNAGKRNKKAIQTNSLFFYLLLVIIDNQTSL